MKTYSQRLKLDQHQALVLETLSMEHRQLYNHLLGYLKTNKLDFKQLNAEYVAFRHAHQLTIPSKSAQNTCRNLIANIKSYLALKKTDNTAKFPYKFRSYKRGFTAFEYDWNSGNGGFKVLGDKLVLLKPKLELKLSSYLQEKLAQADSIKLIRFYGRGDDIYLQVVIGEEVPVSTGYGFLSVDLGLKSIISGVSSDGFAFTTANFDFRKADRAIDRAKSKLDRKQKHSKRWQRLKAAVSKSSKRVVNKRKDYQHKLTSAVISFCKEHDLASLYIGDIQTKKIKSSRGMNRAMQNRGTLSRVKTFLAYKAEAEGMDARLVNEAYTSKTNCLTGELMKLTLGTRVVDLGDEILLDRDLNGAINIAARATQGGWSASEGFIRGLRNVRVTVRE